MKNKMNSGISLKKKIGALREKCLPYNEQTVKGLSVVGLVLFCWLLVWALWLKFNDNNSITLHYRWFCTMTDWERFSYDLIPFQVREDHLKQILEIVANCVVFAPFGVLFNILFEKKNILRDLAICFAISLGFELLQYFTMIGNFATTDLITNTVGYFVGYAFYELIFKKRTDKTKIIVLFIAVAFAFVLTLFSVVRTALNIEPVIGYVVVSK